ncbi:molybdopterin/thiamine biosynthesis adenylyltransferase [Orenia metallireducens]|uniref:Molybdopterin or thiamine biosynthesis adenylyltransferase n=1 Tax=Orenia metallireducens TaxID=1413210 RepID=A0A285GCP6_9FIRM|nr:HesA/MoeB/ThiF family protein [Orenia metallireducens]PRX32493.1 molybdopterin/thiamine biosynthesis adenylyltransferase [Orenia metallireducens]SNY21083.1 Molybdopterin or thiamine biosynthesis adenylyltransferase [Orenia metallireducens]
MYDFSEEQLQRYSRHIILQDVGVEGQEKLLTSSVLIIGTGGLGTPAAQFLAAAGIGKIGLVDADKVELSNLQRQVLHHTPDVGKLKVQSAKEKINAMNPDVEVKTYDYYLTSQNIKEVIREYDFVIDGTDNFPAKFLINDACVMEGKPFSHAGIIRFGGQTTTVVPGEDTPCYRCMFPQPPKPGSVPSCKEAGVIGVMGGVIGTIQATEAIKYILGKGELLTGKLLTYDALKMDFRKINLNKRENCGICSDDPEITELIDYEQGVCEL